MEPLGGAASVIAVVQISDRILSLCGKYSLAVRDAREDIRRLGSEIRALRDVMVSVDEMVQSPDAMRLHAFNSLADTITQCLSDLNNLERRLDPGRGRKTMGRIGARALKWPFKSKDIVKVIEAVDRHKGTISLALHADQRQESKCCFQTSFLMSVLL